MKKLFLLLVLGLGIAVPSAEGQFRRPLPNPIRPNIPPHNLAPLDPEMDFVGGSEHDGRHLICDLPRDMQLKNKVGTDGSGLCVWASLDIDAQYQNVTPLIGFLDYMTKYRGGGWPKKVDDYIPKKADGAPVRYQQSTTADEKLFEMFLRTHRPIAITYGYSARYKDRSNPDGRIDHMVVCVHLDEKWGAVYDNNFPGTFEWCSRRELFRRWELGDLGGWLVGYLDPPPPPKPQGNS